jgi:hypothetical protein
MFPAERVHAAADARLAARRGRGVVVSTRDCCALAGGPPGVHPVSCLTTPADSDANCRMGLRWSRN